MSIDKIKKFSKIIVALFVLILILVYHFYYRPLFLVRGLITLLITSFTFAIAIFFGLIIIGKMKSWKKAGIEELNREDAVFIEGIGLLQATILIFLSELIGSGPFSLFFKGNIVIITAVFYILRGYAHIKNDSRWRWHSIKVLIIVLFYEIPLFIVALVQGFLDLKLGDYEVFKYSGFSIFIFTMTLYDEIKKFFFIRYDLPYRKDKDRIIP